MYGSIQAGNTKWVWDYARDEPAKEKDILPGSERHKASERAKWQRLGREMVGDE